MFSVFRGKSARVRVQSVTVALSHVFLAVHATVVPHNVFLSHTPIVRVIKRRERRVRKTSVAIVVYRYSGFPAAVQSHFLTACAQRTTRWKIFYRPAAYQKLDYLFDICVKGKITRVIVKNCRLWYTVEVCNEKIGYNIIK